MIADASHISISRPISRFCTEWVSEPELEIIHAGLRNRCGAVERDAAGCFDDQTAGHYGDRLAHRIGIEIVDQYDVGQSDVEHFGKLIERVDLDLDLHQMADRGFGAGEHGADAAGDGDVVVLDQDRIVETEAVIEAAAAAHGVFLDRAQSRRGFARTDDARLGVGDLLHERRGRGGDAGHVADEIQRRALGGQNRPCIARNGHQLRAGADLIAVAAVRFDRRCAATAAETPPRPAAGRTQRRACARRRRRGLACPPARSRLR